MSEIGCRLLSLFGAAGLVLRSPGRGAVAAERQTTKTDRLSHLRRLL